MQETIHLPHDHGTSMQKLLDHSPEQETFDKATNIFGLISDPTRLKILWLLCHSEDCVINIAAAVGMSSPAVSHHLRLLKQAGIIASRKEGKEVYYKSADNETAIMVHKIIDAVFDMHCFK